MLPNSCLTVFRGKRALFFQLVPYSATSCSSDNVGCMFCIYWHDPSCAGSIKKAIGNDLFLINAYVSVVLWTIALWSSKLGWASSQHKMSFLLRQKTWHYLPLFPPFSEFTEILRNFSDFHLAWPTCIDSIEIFAPCKCILCFRAKSAVELILVHYIINAYLDFRTISKKFRSLWHFWTSVVSCSHTLPLIIGITVAALTASPSYHRVRERQETRLTSCSMLF